MTLNLPLWPILHFSVDDGVKLMINLPLDVDLMIMVNAFSNITMGTTLGWKFNRKSH